MPASAPFPLTGIQLDALVAQLPDAVVVEDEHRRLHLANASFCLTFGIDAPPEALRGADCAAAAERVAGDFVDPAAFLAGIEAHLQARTPRSGERLALRDGRTLERDYIPVWADEVYRGHLWVYRDVTALAAAKNEVERSHAELERFVDLLSHELRSPLATAAIVAEQLRATRLDPGQAELVSTLQSAVDALTDVVDETHDRALVNLDEAAMALTFEPCRVGDAVRAVVAVERVHALRKGLAVDVYTDGVAGLEVWLDRGRFRMVVSNLVRNAIRYTDVGRVQVRVRAEAVDRPGHRLLDIRVIDSGVGIREADHAAIFEPYTRGRNAVAKGMGLGLFLSRHIAEAMGGSLELVRSTPRGSEFRLQVAVKDVRVDEAPALADARVLVVDDDPSMTRLLVHVLAQEGATGVAARSVEEALAALDGGSVDAALVDYSLGGGSSEALISALRRLGVPVVVLSGHDDPAIVARIETLDIHTRLRKPAPVGVLLTTLRVALQSPSRSPSG